LGKYIRISDFVFALEEQKGCAVMQQHTSHFLEPLFSHYYRYYASWQWYDRSQKAAPSNMDFTKLDRVNFAFFQTDTDGNLWGTDSW
jgi:GH18 family chitinase